MAADRRRRQLRPGGREASREQWWRGRLDEAPTARQQLWVAWDWWRTVTRGNEAEVREVATWLANRALQMMRGGRRDGHGQREDHTAA